MKCKKLPQVQRPAEDIVIGQKLGGNGQLQPIIVARMTIQRGDPGQTNPVDRSYHRLHLQTYLDPHHDA